MRIYLILIYCFTIVSCKNDEQSTINIIDEVKKVERLIANSHIGYNEIKKHLNLSEFKHKKTNNQKFCNDLSEAVNFDKTGIIVYQNKKSCFPKQVKCSNSHIQFIKGNNEDTLYLPNFQVKHIVQNLILNRGNQDLKIVIDNNCHISLLNMFNLLYVLMGEDTMLEDYSLYPFKSPYLKIQTLWNSTTVLGMYNHLKQNNIKFSEKYFDQKYQELYKNKNNSFLEDTFLQNTTGTLWRGKKVEVFQKGHCHSSCETLINFLAQYSNVKVISEKKRKVDPIYLGNAVYSLKNSNIDIAIPNIRFVK